MSSFPEVLTQVAALWDTRRDELLSAGAALAEALKAQTNLNLEAGGRLPDVGALEAAARGLSGAFDHANGGWGGAPKFPQPAVVEFLLRRHHATGDEATLRMATTTLDAMMRGGIYDQLGGGFHRYATDEIWLVPHFEKMLYDNAQLARVYLHGWQVTGNEAYRRIVEETLDYLRREMLDPAGGFYSAQDADSEGEEGRFFVWTPEEIRSALEGTSENPASDATLFSAAYGVSDTGNFEGSNILFAARAGSEIAEEQGLDPVDVEVRLARAREALLSIRAQRVKPGLDDKVLAAWNGLALAAFAEAARALDRDDYREIAERNASFLLAQMRDPRGRLLRTWKDGHAKLNGYLEDYADVADGLLELYQTTFDPRWFDEARALADTILDQFSDPAGGFFDTSDDHESLIVRPKGLQDCAAPSGGAMAANVLIRIAHYTGAAEYERAAEAAISRVRIAMEQAPLGFSAWLSALDLLHGPPRELAVVGGDPSDLLRVARATYQPHLLVASGETATVALLEGREAIGGQATAYLCQRFTCERPVTTPAELAALLG